MAGEAFAELGPHRRRGLTQDQHPHTSGNDVGVERVPATVVEHRAAGRHEGANVLRDRAVMYVAMASVDIDRMLGIPEGDPIAHRLVPCSPNPGGRLRALVLAHHLGKAREQVMADAWSG